MGCPNKYYKKVLQTFSHSLNYLNDNNRAGEMFREQNEEILEKDIMVWKNKMSERQFYYDAGKASESVLTGVYENEGCDGFNACIGGLALFDDFIGISNE